jgi:hypothetical protein
MSLMNFSMHTSHRLSLLLAVAWCSLLLGGCLTAEQKEYHFLVKPDGSGSGELVFHNIMSLEEDGTNKSAQDYYELVTSFLKGTKFEEQNPALGNVRKRLFEKDGQLQAEVLFDFLSYEDVGLYRYQGTGPWMFHPSTSSKFSSETFQSSNGEFAGDKMPVVFWPETTNDFRVTVVIEEPSPQHHSLLPYYKRGGTE